MKKMMGVIVFCASFLLAMAGFSNTASAYIDPSAMTYIVQVVVGIVVVGGAAFGFYFNKLKRAFRKKGEKKAEAVQVVAEEDIDDNGEFDDFELAEE